MARSWWCRSSLWRPTRAVVTGPGFSSAAPPEQAEGLYAEFVATLRRLHPSVASGVFGADMKVALVNDGPVTFLLQRP